MLNQSAISFPILAALGMPPAISVMQPESDASARGPAHGAHPATVPQEDQRTGLDSVAAANHSWSTQTPTFSTRNDVVATASDAAAPVSFTDLARRCAPDVDPVTLAAIVRTESSGNPFAIGVVGARLLRQPRSYAQALEAVRLLRAQGYNFSLGLSQINQHNLVKYGQTEASIFDPCTNLHAGGIVLRDCFARARPLFASEQQALRAAVSCYYAGNFTTGFRDGYVAKVIANAADRPDVLKVPAIRLESDAPTAAERSPALPTPVVVRSAPPQRSVAQTNTLVHDDDIGTYVAAQPNGADHVDAP
ncbi:lytic transglycosylase domain-containing protein [Ralstonia sp.]|uniref:lytic transglycosylase domain-containing protein n=1 Tax=Ralstonia sp. TaxID=54061 RepID=UPI0031DD5DA8